VKCINSPRICWLCLKPSSNSGFASLQSPNLLRIFIYGPKYIDQRIPLMRHGIMPTLAFQAGPERTIANLPYVWVPLVNGEEEK
jgi:hypothetical protein